MKNPEIRRKSSTLFLLVGHKDSHSYLLRQRKARGHCHKEMKKGKLQHFIINFPYLFTVIVMLCSNSERLLTDNFCPSILANMPRRCEIAER